MNDFIVAELRFFLSSLLWGALLYFAYDLLRVFRNVFHHVKFIIAIEDIVFWITAGILIFRMMYQLNDGIIRYYAVISIILGMKVYQITLSIHIVKLLSAGLSTIKGLIRKLLHFLATPFRFALNKLKLFVRLIAKMVKKRYSLITNCLKKQLKKQLKKYKIKRRKKQVKQGEEPKPKQLGTLELITISKDESNETI